MFNALKKRFIRSRLNSASDRQLTDLMGVSPALFQPSLGSIIILTRFIADFESYSKV
ncbi:MAG: hypothetical protein Q4E74_08930 [Ruminococcus sp.]|nr:hypothetical protein [Ruminococcus sp.]